MIEKRRSGEATSMECRQGNGAEAADTRSTMEAESSNRANAYVLGSDPVELDRLDRQAAWLEPATRLLLNVAGITPGMRVVDLGTGLGHVARLTGELVGPAGSVIGVDRAAPALAEARRRVEAAGEHHISFVEGDVSRWCSDDPVDAVVGRLVLFHVTDPVLVVRHQIRNLRTRGVFVAIDFDIGGARAEPPVPLVSDLVRWIEQAFSAAGAAPRVGARLRSIVTDAGLSDPTTIGIQSYLPPHDLVGPALLAGVVRSLTGAITQHRIATIDQLGLPTLEQRIADELRAADAVLLPPTVVGAWGRRTADV
jgi:ubiquinone/menaquinone biosynthesis C-methylase UbiE